MQQTKFSTFVAVITVIAPRAIWQASMTTGKSGM
jgi:hypothetical protein